MERSAMLILSRLLRGFRSCQTSHAMCPEYYQDRLLVDLAIQMFVHCIQGRLMAAYRPPPLPLCGPLVNARSLLP